MADHRPQSYERSERDVPTTSSSGDSSSHSARNSFLIRWGIHPSTWNRPSSDQSASNGESSNLQRRYEEQNEKYMAMRSLSWKAVEAREAQEKRILAARAAKNAIKAGIRAKQEMEAAINDKTLKNNEAFKSVKLSHDAKLAKIEIESKLAAATVSGNIEDIKAFEVKLSKATEIALKAEERATRKLAEAEVASVRATRKLAEEELALKRVNDANKVRDEKAEYVKLAEEKLAAARRLVDEPRAVREARLAAEERAANEAKIAKVRAATEAKIAESEAARELKMADEDNAKVALETAITKEDKAVKEDEKLITVLDQSVRKAIEARLTQAKEAREAAEVRAVDTREIRVAEEISLRAAKAALVSNKSVSEKIQDQLLEFSEVVDDLMEKKEGEGLVVWSIVANWRKDGDIRYEPRNPIERKSMIWALEEFNKWQERKVEKDQIE